MQQPGEIHPADRGPGTRGWEDTPKERAAQLVARAAILKIPHFPELEKRLISIFGVAPAVVFLHQMIWWFGRPKMADRWSMYKTADEWYEERGLNPKALKKARDRTIAAGIIAEKKGAYKKIHYRPDWVRLADLLQCNCPMPEVDTTSEMEKSEEENGSRSTPLRARSQNETFKVSKSIDTLGVRSNSEDHAENQRTEDYALQASADASSSRSADASINMEHLAPSGTQNEITPPQLLPGLDEWTKARVREMIVNMDRDDDVTRFSDHHLNGRADVYGEPFTVERVAEKLREHLDDKKSLKAYTPWVRRYLEERRVKRQEVHL
jgi:hypothetical protein